MLREFAVFRRFGFGISLLAAGALANPSVISAQEAASEEAPSQEMPKPKKTKKKSKSRSKADANRKKGKKVPEADGEEEAPPGEGASVKAAESDQAFKKIGLGLNAGFVYVGGGGGLEGWFSPSRRLDLGLRIIGGSAKIAASGDAVFLETADITMVQLGAHTRFFLGNSFYLLGGLGYNTFAGGYGVTINSTKKEYLLPMKASALSLNIGIGNMWKWDSGFTLGFDWIGYSSFTGMSVALEDPETDEEKAVFDTFRVIPGGGDPEKKAKDLLMKNNIYALLMTLGYRF